MIFGICKCGHSGLSTNLLWAGLGTEPYGKQRLEITERQTSHRLVPGSCEADPGSGVESQPYGGLVRGFVCSCPGPPPGRQGIPVISLEAEVLAVPDQIPGFVGAVGNPGESW